MGKLIIEFSDDDIDAEMAKMSLKDMGIPWIINIKIQG